MSRAKRDKRGSLDLRVESVIDLIESNPSMSVEDACGQAGFEFKALSKGTRNEILNGVKDFIRKYGGIPDEFRAELVRSVRNADLMRNLEIGNLTGASLAADKIATEPNVGLTHKQNTEINFDMTGLDKIAEIAKDLDYKDVK